ncbi:ATP-dependent endonuclease [Nitratireductor kimnyeongensis]|uniref:ATP-dependent endonuclease n=1 Tax=Nitratireductor kimnyeongensis TaxID=430679 RepID=A0ABW0T8G4_9HYPH|nr:AAA family ATPase [Nitratireductor kimnyeongensis]QZZ36059.1 ATP-binding protein [Nitratireductor kimnyeongensis]
MKIVSISIENFRSIISAKKIPFDNYTLLMGPNNEGKSNILQAFSIAMEILKNYKPRIVRQSGGRETVLSPDTRYRYYMRGGYNWERDYPLGLQSKRKHKPSSIVIEILLDQDEVEVFRNKIGSSLNGTLPIKIIFHKDEFAISIAKPGRGQVTLNKKTARIASFVSERMQFEYIPAIRTSKTAYDIIQELVNNELSRLSEDENYKKAIETIENLQAPVLDELSENISTTVSGFLSSVKTVKITTHKELRSRYFRQNIEVQVNDGERTSLERKGDGVQSLVSLALMRHASERLANGGNSIVAIEEPESHLHPKAIRDLRDIIFELSQENQVVVSSHSPLLVRWQGPTSTVIVRNNRASEATKISEVRDALGVVVSDNLTSVEFSLIVEGATDAMILDKIIKEEGAPELKAAFDAGRFALRPANGANKLSYLLASSEQNILGLHVFLDNDDAARREIEKALQERTLESKQYTLCTCQGMHNSEIEDLINPETYQEEILNKFGVDLNSSPFKGNDIWSNRIKATFLAAGKIWNDETKKSVKISVAKSFKESVYQNSIISQKRTSLDNLLNSLSSYLK